MHGFWGIDSLYQMIFSINMYQKKGKAFASELFPTLPCQSLAGKNPCQVRGYKEIMTGWQLGLGSQHFLVRKLVTTTR